MLENFARWCIGSTTPFDGVRVGSNPARVTYRRLAQLVRAFGLHPKGHRFESYIFYNWEYRIVAIATDCKSVLIRVRRFESFYSHNWKCSSVGRALH